MPRLTNTVPATCTRDYREPSQTSFVEILEPRFKILNFNASQVIRIATEIFANVQIGGIYPSPEYVYSISENGETFSRAGG